MLIGSAPASPDRFKTIQKRAKRRDISLGRANLRNFVAFADHLRTQAGFSTYVLDLGGNIRWIGWIKQQRALSKLFFSPRNVRCNNRTAQRECFQRRKIVGPEIARENERRRRPVQGVEIFARDEARDKNPIAEAKFNDVFHDIIPVSLVTAGQHKTQIEIGLISQET